MNNGVRPALDRKQIPPALAVWSFNFALESDTELDEEIPPASAGRI
jgi:hypothetical protein